MYLLGAIEPAQRAQLDRHLAACPQCRAELAALAGLPALLRRVPPGEALRLALGNPGLAGPPLTVLLGRAARARRSDRRRLSAAAAVITAAVAAMIAVCVAVGVLTLHAGVPAARVPGPAVTGRLGGVTPAMDVRAKSAAEPAETVSQWVLPSGARLPHDGDDYNQELTALEVSTWRSISA